MPDLIVYAFILYMHNNNDQSLILVVPGTIYYGFMCRVVDTIKTYRPYVPTLD